LRAVGVAYVDGHFVGKLARLHAREPGRGRVQRDPFEQHILVERRQVQAIIAGQAFGNALDLRAFTLMLVAVGERCQQADGDDRSDFCLGHGRSFGAVGTIVSEPNG
jgi:hypothetical protein